MKFRLSEKVSFISFRTSSFLGFSFVSSMASASTCPGLVAVVGDIMEYRDSKVM